MAAPVEGQSSGPAVDRAGAPVVDPSENVKALTEAAVRRLDDMAALRAHCDQELRDQQRYYEDLIRALEKQLAKAESDRIDAIRAVDASNVQATAKVATDQAEAIRQTVAATASAFDIKLAATLDPIQKRIDDLTRAQYEAQGQKTQVVEARGANQYVMGIVIFIITLILVGAPLLVVLANQP